MASIKFLNTETELNPSTPPFVMTEVHASEVEKNTPKTNVGELSQSAKTIREQIDKLSHSEVLLNNRFVVKVYNDEFYFEPHEIGSIAENGKNLNLSILATIDNISDLMDLKNMTTNNKWFIPSKSKFNIELQLLDNMFNVVDTHIYKNTVLRIASFLPMGYSGDTEILKMYLTFEQ